MQNTIVLEFMSKDIRNLLHIEWQYVKCTDAVN